MNPTETLHVIDIDKPSFDSAVALHVVMTWANSLLSISHSNLAKASRRLAAELLMEQQVSHGIVLDLMHFLFP